MNPSLTNYLKTIPGLRIALLFGSCAEGKARPDSDLDIAISTERPLYQQEIQEIISNLAQITNRPIDLIDLEKATGLILKNSLTEGKPLVPSDPATYEKLLKRMIYDEADFQPLIRRFRKERIDAFIHGK